MPPQQHLCNGLAALQTIPFLHRNGLARTDSIPCLAQGQRDAGLRTAQLAYGKRARMTYG